MENLIYFVLFCVVMACLIKAVLDDIRYYEKLEEQNEKFKRITKRDQ
jgi:hypothetical protein